MVPGTRRGRFGADAAGRVPQLQALRFGAVPARAGTAHSSSVSRMLACQALVAVPVVASYSSHELLSLSTGLVLGFLLEGLGIGASKR